ncbi:MAG: hypothetical protein A2427_01435 [Candidatus Nealsonbacteria bacterium RIFOXYC1_FULL_40_7]|uniref:Uncharacterized protein n=1 Tax=Candidatus Nealsonbacteria bacterium RIFOXYC1_FULL_40_7 TaxID=1801678 RepID=A0A1G2ERI2_9BACT|nr:MAG: hypothetical protein A2427_01435 [Candidatus Nealsonbacteria bacterium RIFOXYC1_FULL_40_7]
MAPHIEQYMPSYDIWLTLAETHHSTHDDSPAIRKIHDLAATNPQKYRELGDELGPVCDKTHKQEATPQEQPQEVVEIRKANLDLTEEVESKFDHII